MPWEGFCVMVRRCWAAGSYLDVPSHRVTVSEAGGDGCSSCLSGSCLLVSWQLPEVSRQGLALKYTDFVVFPVLPHKLVRPPHTF